MGEIRAAGNKATALQLDLSDFRSLVFDGAVNLIGFARMEGAWPGSIDIAIKKS